MSVLRPLTLAVGDYDINRGLITGAVSPQGVALTVLTLPSPERHARMALHREFDICEFSMATLLAMHGAGDRSLVAVPAYPHRRFRHGFVYVREGAAIQRPEDLSGRRIGLRTWQTTAGLWLRGILSDEHGVDLRSVEWITQDAEDVPLEHATGYSIRQAAPGENVVDMLLAGELDALIYPEEPRVAGIRPLFADPKAAEIDYFRRTAIFPIMHAVVLRRELAEELAWLPREVLVAFRRSKQLAFDAMRDPRKVSLAWLRQALDEQEAILGPDPWTYDFASNRTTLETIVRYAHEQGFVPEPFSPEDLFAPATVEELPSYV
jgi:4,5-dihydroxyphthalate decarboxylase